ncbi:hypothetical protein IFM89_021629 [Coptis chinensis]|uniref:Bifunctional inhibitor/plant lipid transfer protein/seed storage helical domain-containing protein n=1 Tax=Coptis chinensis TaxID=261450 RepID=A0A835IG05_9MAGN|nr:hypothetical protein IFM89_021629 [Coptis chinensis]
MARFAVVGAVFVVLLALAEARMFETIVSTTEVDEPSSYQSERCRQQGQMMMHSCRQYLQPTMTRPSFRGQMQQCCEELEEVNPECRCEAIRQTVQSMRGYQGGEQMQEMMMRKAQQLPQMCGVEPQYCKIRQESA